MLPGPYSKSTQSQDSHNILIDGYTFYYRRNTTSQGALICLLSKVGSSMWNLLLLKAAGAPDFPDSRGIFSKSGHLARLPISSSVATYELALRTPTVPRFAIVKHPLARLLSGYVGKVVANPTPGLWPSDYDPSTQFWGFVAALEKMNSTKMFRNHFKLQTSQCAGTAPGVGNWTFLRVEEMGHWYEEIVCSLGISSAVSRGWDQFVNTDNDLQKGVSVHSGDIGSAAYHSPSHQSCFVSTGCGCKLDCYKPCERHLRNSNIRHGTFHKSTSEMERYYSSDLAARVNDWAYNDLKALGYKRWFPGLTLAETLVNPLG